MCKVDMNRWLSFHTDSKAIQHMDPALKKSWERSISLNINYTKCFPQDIPKCEFDSIKKKTKRLYVYANSVLKRLTKRGEERDAAVLLFDKYGNILHVYANNKVREWAKRRHIKEGTRWSEECIGTNVFSLGVQTDGETTLVGEENFCKCMIDCAFYFAPIKLQNGDFHGGIVIVSSIDYPSNSMLALAISLSRTVELQLFWFTLLNVTSNIPEGNGTLAIDLSSGKNHILMFTDEAIKMLGVPQKDYFYDKLEDVIPDEQINSAIWSIIHENRKVVDKTVQLTINGQPVVISVSSIPYREEKFHMFGIIINMTSIQRINKLVSKYSGNSARYYFSDIIGQSKQILDIIQRSEIASNTDSNILLLGESGVGKDVFAQAMHNASKRSRQPFVALNCASFSKELIASELFGYENGAFTGAKKDGTIGKFELANNGTLFLDEIGDMPLDLQAILLRVLEENSFRKVGGNKLVNVNVRIIAATNKNLVDKMANGLFREDLFYRLGIIRIHIPQLKNRTSDIKPLVDYFVTQICERLGRRKITFTKKAMTFLMSYSWPGNVRELKNLLEGIISTYTLQEITDMEIRRYLGDFINEFQPDLSKKESTSETTNYDDVYDERKEILNSLKKFNNNKTKAAEYLGMPLRTFYRRLYKYDIIKQD